MGYQLVRKATDVLLDIEADVKKILAHTQNQDFLAKTLADRLSALEKKLTTASPVVKPPVAPAPKTLPGLKPGVQISPNKNQLVKTLEAAQPHAHKSVPVQQVVLYPEGGGIPMAAIEIFSEDTLVKTLKTNAVGKWTNALPPGNYTVHAFKKATNTNKAVEVTMDIEVPESSEPVQLGALQS